jgi:hypothetical protein
MAGLDTWLHTAVALLAAGLGFWAGYRFRGRIARRQRYHAADHDPS